MNRILPLLLVPAGLIVALMIVETGFRAVSYFHREPRVWTDRPEFYFAPEDASTLQDHVYSSQKPAGTFRIGVVGDSYSFAPFMQFTDAYPKVLERMLNMNSGAPKTEVINFAVPALSTHHEIQFMDQALKQGADLIILQITLNDAEYKALTPTGIQTGVSDPFAPLRPEGFYGFARKYWKSAAFVMERIHNSRTHRAYTDYFIRLFEHPGNWKLFQKSLRKMSAACRKRGVPMIAVVFPLFGLPLDEHYPFTALHRKVGALLDSLQIDHLDLFDTYAGIPLERIQVIPGEDRHPNEIAHRMAAERLYAWLAEKSLIPDSVKIRKRYSQRLGSVGQPEYPQ